MHKVFFVVIDEVDQRAVLAYCKSNNITVHSTDKVDSCVTVYFTNEVSLNQVRGWLASRDEKTRDQLHQDVIGEFDAYQTYVGETSFYPKVGENLAFVVLSLCGEVGELANHVKKIERDDKNVLTPLRRQLIIKEVGDVLWYAAAICNELEIPLKDVIRQNVAKLDSRMAREKIHGDGDDR